LAPTSVPFQPAHSYDVSSKSAAEEEE